ncbi:MAG: ABC transporter ATP-binding protein/permease [Lachnospiraceae bacterium]|nr:ABC transporter ATP-binding protein/permease [Lachnospiraceae bacterium]
MKNLLKYLRKYRIESVLAPLFKMLEAAFELTVPLVVASMIDNGIGNGGNGGHIVRCFVIMIILGIVGLVASCTAQFFAAKAATGFSKELRSDLMRHILGLNFRSIDNAGTSTLITRMTADVNTVQNGVNMFLRLFLRSPFIVAGAMVMAFFIDVKSALIFVAVIAVLSVTVALIMSSNIPLLKKVQSKLDEVLNLTRETLQGVRVIRAFAYEERQYDEFKKSNDELSGMQQRAGRISGLLNPLTYVIINLAIAFLIMTGSDRVYNGILTTGQVVALYNYMSQILLELIKFAGLIITINKALASANRISEVFGYEAGMEMPDDPITVEAGSGAGIEFKNVSMAYYEGADEALSNISFKMEPGQTLGIIGGTGSGKTTLVNLIPRFYDVTSGEVLINGRNVKEYDVDSLRKNTAIVMQKAALFAGTIRENLLWGNEKASEEDLMSAVEAAVATDVINAKGGLDGAVEAGGKNLSGGQRQRLTIARALVRRPGILILDDASSALDYVTDLKLRTNIKELSYKPTVVIVSQRTASVQHADRILVLDDGEAAGFGTHEELLESCEVYKEIYDSQLKKEVG